MRKLGIVGGTSWHSSARYYEYLNRGVARRFGGYRSAPLVLESLDFAEIAELQQAQRWDEVVALTVAAAQRVVAAGAEAVLLASNALHRAQGAVEAATGLPVIDIRTATAARLVADGRRRVALFGSRPTMTEAFARAAYEAHGIAIQNLPETAIEEVERVIFDELVKGEVSRESQRNLRTIITELAKQKVEAIVLGCTELSMAVDTRANILPVYDTTAIHAAAALQWMTGEPEELRLVRGVDAQAA